MRERLSTYEAEMDEQRRREVPAYPLSTMEGPPCPATPTP